MLYIWRNTIFFYHHNFMKKKVILSYLKMNMCICVRKVDDEGWLGLEGVCLRESGGTVWIALEGSGIKKRGGETKILRGGKLCLRVQAFTKALFSISVFPKRFSFFTVCLFQWLCMVASWWTAKGKFLEFRSADCCKMHFFFLEISEFYWEFLRKLVFGSI